MLRSMRFRTKLMLIVIVPMIGALVVAVPGLRTRLHDLDASTDARSQLAPAATVQKFLSNIDDEGSVSAWWTASTGTALQGRLRTARAATDRAAGALGRAQRRADRAGAADAAREIRALQTSLGRIARQREFIDLRITPDGSVLNYFRDLGSEATGILDAFARAPQGAAAAIMFRDAATLARLENALADERSVMTVAASRGVVSDELASDLISAVTSQDAARTALENQGRAATRSQVRRGVGEFQTAIDRVRERRAPVLTSRALRPTDTASDWYRTATAQLRGWRRLGDQINRGIAHDLARRQDDAGGSLRLVGLGSLAVLLVAAGLAYLIARATTRPLRQLAENAHDVATRQLPALVAALHDPTAEPPTITPITVHSRDELGALAKAFNHVERTTLDVAELQRETVRTGISDLFVNLARRNQPLISRQLSVIDGLEHDERDPERLGALFTLDHLATRMRRNSDSLLVLAGVDEKTASRPKVALLDVVRGAVSETTDFPRIDTAGITADVEIVGYAATDVAHLLSELLENATAFSTPASRVLVTMQSKDGGVELTISDKGIGIPPERMTSLNKLLADPPPPGLVMSRSLGLVVVARLAQRTGVLVSLRSAPNVGTAAVLQLPGAIVRSVSDSRAVTAAVPVDAIDLTATEATEDSEPVIDLSAEAAVAREPVPASASLPSGLDETDAGLPRRRPADPSNGGTDSSGDIAAPPSRPAEAVFELVARFEAGRRRAQTDEPNDEGDAS